MMAKHSIHGGKDNLLGLYFSVSVGLPIGSPLDFDPHNQGDQA